MFKDMKSMQNRGNNVTINDVARAAGVSKGTVDRVLHNRGEVSGKSREKVLKVIEELGFRPNFHASLLASQKERLIKCIIPEFVEGEFWSLAARGIQEAAARVARFGIRLETVMYEQYSVDSFRKVCDDVLENPPSGVIVAPMFAGETMKFAASLASAGVPYVFIDSKIDDDGYLSYFGMPMYESGRLCADILTDGRDVPGKVFVVRIARDKSGLSDPTADRRAGFMAYMREHYPDVKIENVFIDPKDRAAIVGKLDAAIGAEEGAKFIVMFNSRIHIVADYIEERELHDCRVIGFDCLEKNIEALRRGTVQTLIAQHTDRLTADAVNALSDYLIFGNSTEAKENYTQMDILTRYNCDYYI